ncbi:MAG: reverse transcriptase domain-containing protein [Candidatus Moranbacteria bacterium]|nr:reverse transcriptase domain-containing protein [Candidatus Moranbacteria bacterium]
MEHGLKKILPVFVDASLVKEMMEVAITYRRREEPKKIGGVRIIHAPNKALKKLQKRLLQFLYEWTLPPDFFGFVREKNIVDNALSHHVGAQGVPEWSINIDLKNAFPSVTKKILRKTLRRAFEQLQFPERKKIRELGNISIGQFQEIFLRTVLRWGRLPQGAPTSPYLLNLVLLREGILIAIEDVFMRLGVSLGNLSIYADDISITTHEQPSRELINAIIAAV